MGLEQQLTCVTVIKGLWCCVTKKKQFSEIQF